MAEGDWGLTLPVTINGTTLTEHDEIKLIFKDAINGNTLFEKNYTDISDNTVDFVITEAETALLPVGSYVYSLDWYQDGAFMCNIIPTATLRVVDKA